jgi:hypothetical protein
VSARRLPGIAFVLVGVAAALAIAAASVEGLRHRELQARVAAADSTAEVRRLEAVILRRDLRAAKERR